MNQKNSSPLNMGNQMSKAWYRTKDLLYFKATGESWDILHWTDEEYEIFLGQGFPDQVEQLATLNKVGTK